MAFWILVALLVSAVTFAITWPLMRSPPTSSAMKLDVDADVAVYKDQLEEVAADEERGALAAEEAKGARIEIARRLLRSSRQRVPSTAKPRRDRLAPVISAALSVALPVLSLALYLVYGAPGMPGEPLSARLAEAVSADKPNDLVAKVEERLREHPEDGAGWDVIAPVYYAMGRYADAAGAYDNAIKLRGETAARLQGFANARIRTENGVIPEDARKALERILVLKPDAKEPRIWLALAKEQDGRIEEAAADYRKLIDEEPADAPWKKVLEERLAALTKGESKAVPTGEQNAAAAAPANADVAAPKPNTEPDAAAVMSMNPQERQAFITSMVDGLAQRLRTDGTDAAGWVKLIRAYDVLGRRDDAKKALSDARAKLKRDEVGLARVEDLARQLGLGS